MPIPAKRLCVTSDMSGAASNPDLLSRAYAAYFRSGGVDLPSKYERRDCFRRENLRGFAQCERNSGHLSSP
jgi:hypothetical protein